MNLTAQNTAVVLDSTADFPEGPARYPNWRVVPLYVNLDGLSYLRDTKSGPAPALESIGHRGADDGDDDNDDHRVGECF